MDKSLKSSLDKSLVLVPESWGTGHLLILLPPSCVSSSSRASIVLKGLALIQVQSSRGHQIDVLMQFLFWKVSSSMNGFFKFSWSYLQLFQMDFYLILKWDEQHTEFFWAFPHAFFVSQQVSVLVNLRLEVRRHFACLHILGYFVWFDDFIKLMLL